MIPAVPKMPPVGGVLRERRTSPLLAGNGALRLATRMLRGVFNSASGLALLWVGWVVMVFYAVLWFMTGEVDPDIRRWQGFVMMALLAQSAIVTGIGLAVLDVVPVRPQPRPPTTREAPAEMPPQVLPTPPQARVAAMPPFPAASVSGRAARLFPDGSIEIETKLGRRRFPSPADAIRFVGPGALAASSLH
jgi:hypothetical protein